MPFMSGAHDLGMIRRTCYFLPCSEARQRYWTGQQSFEDEICKSPEKVSPPSEMIVSYKCPLFARKFPQGVSDAAFQVLTNCEYDLQVCDSKCRSTPTTSVR